MGFFPTSCYIPEIQRETFWIIVDGMKADYFLQLCELPVDDKRRRLLANSNYTRTVMPSTIHFLAKTTEHQFVKDACKEILHHLVAFATAKNSINMSEEMDSNTIVEMASLAVAHSAQAAVLWRDLQYRLEEMAKGSPDPGSILELLFK